MKRFALGLLQAAALGALLAGCGAKIPPTHHYTLEAPLPQAASSSLPYAVAVARFGAPRALSQDRLVYRPSAHKVDFYEYHRWAETPPDMVTNSLIRHLKGAQVFRSVTAFQGAPQADFILRGNIESLEEIDSGETVTARVAINAELVDGRTRAIVWTGRGAQDTTVQDRSIDGIVRALNEGLRQSLEQITRGLSTHLAQQPRPAQ